MKEFLRSVAEHYVPEIKTADGRTDSLGLADHLFVFPNRRSGLFFNKYLMESVDAPVFAPQMTTISELFLTLGAGRGLRVADRIELLFRLFNIYKAVSGSAETFDAFVFWGEMLLADFNDADKYLVDARLLFENVKDLKEIDDKFAGLEPEQIKVIRQFWTNFNPATTGQSKEVFRQTWAIMHRLYEELRAGLLRDGAAYEGMLQRLVVEELTRRRLTAGEEEERARLVKLLGRKVVFVGLTALSKTETELMAHLERYGLADFCWDYADARLNDRNSHASYFRPTTIDVFPNAIDEEELREGLTADSEKRIEVLEVPSGVGQTAQAARVLQQWAAGGGDALRTAVVLPDEKLLLPMLYCVPKEYEPFNVTMGYSLKGTGIANFIGNLAQLQANIQRNREGAWTFYYKNVQPLLGTNYLLMMSDGKADELARDIVKNNRYRIPAQSFRGNRLMEAVFRPCLSGEECIEYLTNILHIFAMQAEKEQAEKEEREEAGREELFQEETDEGVFSEVDREFLYTYITLLENLAAKIRKFGMEVSVPTFFLLLHRLAQGETVAFSGEPLLGLQVMGVLETRGLDFENLIILSMNEGVFPAKQVTNTFIPMNLRSAFGLPTQAHRDAVYAYHFYRLISRARNVVLIYDSRTDGMQSGEPSRYIKQLSYLYGFKLTEKSVQYNIKVSEPEAITVAKDARVMARLEQCVSGVGRRNLSATALKHYIMCPLWFYFEFVEGLRDEDEIEENIDDRTFGLIVHAAMEEIYAAVVGREVRAEDLERVIKDRDYLRRVVERHFHKVMKVNEIGGYLLLVEEIILTYVTDILEHDRKLAPFHYVASEIKETYAYEFGEGAERKTVNVVAIFDRIDRVGETLRIVDYKTGGSTNGERSKMLVPEISRIFAADSPCSTEAFQIMLYSLLYNTEAPISPNLYFVRDFHRNAGLCTQLQYEPAGKEPMGNFKALAEEFKAAFDALLAEIFDPAIPFAQTSLEKNCQFCSFKEICKRGIS